MSKEIIVLDGDGVVIDYHEGYAMAWERAFGGRPSVRNPDSYYARHYWDVPVLSDEGFKYLREHGFCSEIWESMPLLSGVIDACKLLTDAGFRLIVVTAAEVHIRQARINNLRRHNLPIEDVITIGRLGPGNVKMEAVNQLRPVAFVDDYIGYLQGLHPDIWRALIMGRPEGSPNSDPYFVPASANYKSLLEFAQQWVTRKS
jgi:hypothetical protein